jgi:small subunit ribosomal protein S16
MSVMIKLSRVGRNKLPHFRISVIDKQYAPKSGKALEYIGTYSPIGENERFDIKEDRLKFWTDKGALVSDRIASLIKKHVRSTS